MLPFDFIGALLPELEPHCTFASAMHHKHYARVNMLMSVFGRNDTYLCDLPVSRSNESQSLRMDVLDSLNT